MKNERQDQQITKTLLKLFTENSWNFIYAAMTSKVVDSAKSFAKTNNLLVSPCCEYKRHCKRYILSSRTQTSITFM